MKVPCIITAVPGPVWDDFSQRGHTLLQLRSWKWPGY